MVLLIEALLLLLYSRTIFMLYDFKVKFAMKVRFIYKTTFANFINRNQPIDRVKNKKIKIT